METQQAAEHLQVIRTLMERSALYRRALAPIMTFCGVLGIVASLAGWQLKLESGRAFLLLWGSTGVGALVGSFLLVRRQALKDSEPFWSAPTKRVTQAMLPPLFIGLVLGILLNKSDEPSIPSVIALAWTALYGCALHAAGFFISRGFQILGWIYCALGCVLLTVMSYPIGDNLHPHLLMGALFGGLHLIAGIYLYFTEKRGNES